MLFCIFMTIFRTSQHLQDVQEKDWFGTYGNLIQSITITALDIIFLAGSIFSSIPAMMTYAAFTALNFAGILSWSFYTDQTQKYAGDLYFSLKNKNHLVTFSSFLKIVFIVTSIALLALNTFAATFQLLSFFSVTQQIYAFMRPFGIPSLALSLFLDFLNYYLAKRALSIKTDQETIPQVFQNFQNEGLGNKESINASYIRGCIDKDTWKHFIKCLPFSSPSQQEDLYNKVLIPNIITQRTAIVSNLFLRGLGEIGMFVSIVYPGTTIQAACWTILSSLYTGQLAYQHYHQYHQRKFASEISLP
jgi:hypothetical protein